MIATLPPTATIAEGLGEVPVGADMKPMLLSYARRFVQVELLPTNSMGAWPCVPVGAGAAIVPLGKSTP